MVCGALQTVPELCWELDSHGMWWSGKQCCADSVTNTEHFMSVYIFYAECYKLSHISQSGPRVDPPLCGVFFCYDSYKNHKEEVWSPRRWKSLTNVIFYWAFHYVYWNNLGLLLSVHPCVSLWIGAIQHWCLALLMQRECVWKKAKLKEIHTFAGGLDTLFASALGPHIPCSVLVGKVICKTLQSGCCWKLKDLRAQPLSGGFQEEQSWDLDLACPSAVLLQHENNLWCRFVTEKQY